MGIRPLQLDVTEGGANNTTVPTLGKVEDLIGAAALLTRVTGTPNYLLPKTALDDFGATLARITKGWFTDVESYNMYTVGGTSINANAVLDLTADEVTQLAAIGTTTISAGQWVYLGAMNQGVATTDTPSFAQLTVDNIRINGNTILVTNADGSLTIDCNGAGTVDIPRAGTFGAVTAATQILVGNLDISGNTLASISGNLNLTPVAGSSAIIDSHWGFDGIALTMLTDNATTITAYSGKDFSINGGDNADIFLTAGVNGYVKMDNVRIYSSTIETTAGALSLIPVAGTYVIIDSHWGFDANALTSLTDNNTILNAYAGKNITIESVTFDGGLLTANQVTADNLVLNANTLSSTSGNINITPDNPADDIILNGHWSFDGKTLVAISDSDTTLTAYAGKNIAIEGVTFDGGVVASITALTADQLTVDSIVLNAAAITITENSTDFTFECKRLNPGDGNDLYIYGSNGVNAGAGADGGDIIISTRQGVAGGVDGEIYLQVGGVTKASITDDYFVSTGYVLQTGIFAEIYVADASAAQSIATGVTYTKSTAFTSNGQSANCTSDATNDKITITQIGRYRASGSCSGTSGKANLTWRGAAFLNGVEQDQVHWKRKMTTTTDSGDMSFTGFIDVTSVPWDLDFRLRHDDGGNQNFTIEYANLNVEYIGAT